MPGEKSMGFFKL
jgi:hypothetical protein